MSHEPNLKPGPKEFKRVTQQDIANVVGVHKVTVSDALNGRGRISVEMREKIRQVAQEMNYFPNAAAQALTSGRTGTIAVISGPINEPYYANMIHFLEKHITDAGYLLTLMRSSQEVKGLVDVTSNIVADGAIAIDMQRLVDEFRSHPTVPCVAIGTYQLPFVDCVVSDISEGIIQALKIMMAAGRRRIAYLVTRTVMAEETEIRARTYSNVMREAGRPIEIINLRTNLENDFESKFAEFLVQRGCPDALLCQNDEMAMRVFRTIVNAGYSIPKDVLLAGCDGQSHMKYFNPPLSTIAQPMEEMCKIAWQFLKRRMEYPEIPWQQITLQGHLEIRESLQPHSA